VLAPIEALARAARAASAAPPGGQAALLADLRGLGREGRTKGAKESSVRQTGVDDGDDGFVGELRAWGCLKRFAAVRAAVRAAHVLRLSQTMEG
jgi:hypothetical protein